MTKKDFELIADVLDAASIDCRSQDAETTRRALARAFAGKLAQTNPRFDQARFLKACGVAS